MKFKGYSIADLLDATVEEALPLMENLPQIRAKLQTLHDVGLGYMHLGQSSTTLSGGEAQRIKLAKELSRRQTGRTFYILDEPTTGLHFDDVRKLLDVLQRLVDLGNTVVVIEHNLDVIKTADWIIDLGPDGGEDGGRVVACGHARAGGAIQEELHRARRLRKVLGTGRRHEPVPRKLPLDFAGLKTCALRERGGKVQTARFRHGRTGKGRGTARRGSDSLPRILAARFVPQRGGRHRNAPARAASRSSGAWAGMSIKCGLAPVLIDLMRRGYATAFALNGAAAIHDFEIALAGHTSEDVEAVLPDGRFGSAEETGREMNRRHLRRRTRRHGHGRGAGAAPGAAGRPGMRGDQPAAAGVSGRRR